jgi:hypothetical protein
MLRRKKYKCRVETVALPTELWLIIFDIVIEEGIIWLDQCDYTTFPHVGPSFYASAYPHHFYDSYWRLRLVCRRFNTLLSVPPWQSFSDSASLPFPISTKSLYLNLKTLPKMHFQRLLADTSTCARLVSINVDCILSPCHFLRTSTGQAFPNVQRLVLRFINRSYSPPEKAFWNLLHGAFPLLVTFVLVTEHWTVGEDVQLEEGDQGVCFEKLEILYFGSKITYLGCSFPRLRHAFIWGCSLPELEILTRSPHLESLLIRSTLMLNPNIDVISCSQLKLLGFPDYPDTGVVPLGPDHSVEQIWIYWTGFSHHTELFMQLLRTLPKISRITVEPLSSNWMHQQQRTDEFRGMKLGSFGLRMRPLTMRSSGFPLLIIERVEAGGSMGKVWRKMRR